MKKELLLASQSPRRKELLERITKDFKVVESNIEETMNLSLPIEARIQDLAQKKAHEVLNRYPDAIVIGADTVIVIDDEVIGKPQDREDARNIIKKLMNRTHQVLTAVCIVSDDKEQLFIESCEVRIENITDEELNDYIEHENYFDKAGAYAIQGEMSKYISSIKGDYNTVMGLPVHKVYKALTENNL